MLWGPKRRLCEALSCEIRWSLVNTNVSERPYSHNPFMMKNKTYRTSRRNRLTSNLLHQGAVETQLSNSQHTSWSTGAHKEFPRVVVLCNPLWAHTHTHTHTDFCKMRLVGKSLQCFQAQVLLFSVSFSDQHHVNPIQLNYVLHFFSVYRSEQRKNMCHITALICHNQPYEDKSFLEILISSLPGSHDPGSMAFTVKLLCPC